MKKKIFLFLITIMLVACNFNINTDFEPNKDGDNILPSIPAFPEAEGFGRNVTGGRGGDVVYVTNLNPEGPGSLNEALGYHNNASMKKPRYILFKVSGIVSPGTYLWDHKTHVEYGDFTLAGQTAPGGIVTAGFMAWVPGGGTGNQSNMIIRHLRSRPDNIENSLDDAIRLEGAQNFIIDHCSFGWAGDEAMQIAKNKNISIQNCIFGETLGDHFDRGGILIKYSSANKPNTEISFHHNMINRIGGRLPQCSPHNDEQGRAMDIEISNNLIWDPGSSHGIITPIYFTNFHQESNKYIDWWYRLNMVNNFSYSLPVATITKDWTNAADISLGHKNTQVYSSGNKINLWPDIENKVRVTFDINNSFGKGTLLNSRNNFPTITYTATEDIPNYMIENAGAFPRDSMDRRLINSVKNGIIDQTPCNEKGADDGFVFDWSPKTFYQNKLNSAGNQYKSLILATYADMPVPPLDSDDDGMPDWWEIFNGLNPLEKNHTGKELSKKYTGINGYDNLEVYLNRLSDNLVKGTNMLEGSCKVYDDLLDKTEILNNTDLKAGGNIDFNITLKSGNIKKVELSLAQVTDPFRFPAPKTIDLTAKIVNNKILYSPSIPFERTKGKYSVMIHAETYDGKHDYKIVEFTLL